MFHKMLLDYGKKFTDMWGGADTDELVAHWAAELAGYSASEIKRGLTAMESKDWPATLPEFKKMCRPPVDPLAAYHEALAGLEARGKGEIGTWTHRAIYWAANMLARDLGLQAYAQIKDRWASTLTAQLERSEWAEIPAPQFALSAPVNGEMSKQNAVKMLRKLKALGITKNALDKIDHKAWAQKILDRDAQGDRSLTPIQIQFAKEALI